MLTHRHFLGRAKTHTNDEVVLSYARGHVKFVPLRRTSLHRFTKLDLIEKHHEVRQYLAADRSPRIGLTYLRAYSHKT